MTVNSDVKSWKQRRSNRGMLHDDDGGGGGDGGDFCRDFGRVPWLSAIAVILRHGRDNQRRPIVCNFSIWTVADVYETAVLWQRNREAVVKMEMGSRGSPGDISAFLFNLAAAKLDDSVVAAVFHKTHISWAENFPLVY